MCRGETCQSKDSAASERRSWVTSVLVLLRPWVLPSRLLPRSICSGLWGPSVRWAVSTSEPGEGGRGCTGRFVKGTAARIRSWCHGRKGQAISWEGRREGPGLSLDRASFWGQQHEMKASSSLERNGLFSALSGYILCHCDSLCQGR